MCQCACKICPYISYVLFFNSEFYFYCFIALVNQKSNVQNHCYFFCFCHKSKREEETTKILSLEMTIFGLKMMVKSGLEKNILKFHVPLQRYLLTSQANSAFLGRFFCTGQQQLCKGMWNSKKIL